MMGFVGVLAALISVNGAVAALLPVVVVMAIRLGRSPSQLLMPLVFGAHAGSQLMLTGSPVNVLVVEASENAGGGGFGYFEFALVGIPIVIGCIAIVVLFGERLLPERTSKTLPPDLSHHASTLFEQYRLTGDVHQLRVRAGSPADRHSRARSVALYKQPDLALVTLKDAEGQPDARGYGARGRHPRDPRTGRPGGGAGHAKWASPSARTPRRAAFRTSSSTATPGWPRC